MASKAKDCLQLQLQLQHAAVVTVHCHCYEAVFYQRWQWQDIDNLHPSVDRRHMSVGFRHTAATASAQPKLQVTGMCRYFTMCLLAFYAAVA